MSQEDKPQKAIMIDYDAEKLATDTARHLSPILFEIVESIQKKKDNEKEKPLSKNEAAEFLGIHTSTLSKLISEGRINFTSLNPDNKMSVKKFYRKDLEDFLRKNRTRTIDEIKRDSNG